MVATYWGYGLGEVSEKAWQRLHDDTVAKATATSWYDLLDVSKWPQPRKVLTSDRTIGHNDHEAWLDEQFNADESDARADYARLGLQGFRLSICLALRTQRGGRNAIDLAMQRFEVDSKSAAERLRKAS